jgi:hypothetical protein
MVMGRREDLGRPSDTGSDTADQAADVVGHALVSTAEDQNLDELVEHSPERNKAVGLLNSPARLASNLVRL